MPFGDREDELWDAMKPSFKPRLVSDPNLKYARHVVNGTGPFASKSPAASHPRMPFRSRTTIDRPCNPPSVADALQGVGHARAARPRQR